MKIEIPPPPSPSVIRTLALSAEASPYLERSPGAEGVREAVEGIGFVQIDTISVVERAHHHILATRVPGYAPEDISRNEAAPRSIIEYWAHAACYVPMTDYRYCIPRMQRVLRDGHDWYKVDKKTLEAVYKRVAAEGPLMSKDFEKKPGQKTGWWDWQPSKRALECLFQGGRLVVARREGFQKVFDLAERQLPPGIELSAPSPAEMGRWYVLRSLRTYGLACEEEMRYQRHEVVEAIPAAIQALAEEGTIVELGKIGGKTYYAKAADINLLDCPGPSPNASMMADEEKAPSVSRIARTMLQPECRILSPFDPFIIQRKRVKRLFGWDYTIECYLPEEKREFGYFALPILRGTELAGLIDAKADRKEGKLVVNRLRLDESLAKSEGFLEAFASGISRFATLNGLSRIAPSPVEIGEGKQSGEHAALRKEIKKAMSSWRGG